MPEERKTAPRASRVATRRRQRERSAGRGHDATDWNEALRLHRRGWSLAAIARELGRTYETVRRQLAARGARSIRKWQRTTERHGNVLWSLWYNHRRRCEDPSHRDWSKYGARGIRFARTWRDFDAFYDWAIAAGYRPGLRLDRKDRARGYEPGNCRWATAKEMYARRPTARPPRSLWITAFGERRGPADWSRDPRCSIGAWSLAERIVTGWPPEEAITAPRGASPSRRIRPPARPASRKKVARIDWDEALRLYVEDGLSESEVARRYSATRDGISRGLWRRGIRRRVRHPPQDASERARLREFWWMLRRRCEDPRDPQYRLIGARGIRVCREWQDFDAFFRWARANGARRGRWLSRTDRRKDYSPANCEWVRPAEAVRRMGPHLHKPPPTRLVTAFGQTKGITEWGQDRRARVTASAIGKRLQAGWSTEEAIAFPPLTRSCSDVGFTELEAFGTTKCKSDWLRDPRCRVVMAGLNSRLRRGWSPEDAIATPPYRPPRGLGRRGRRRGRIAAT